MGGCQATHVHAHPVEAPAQALQERGQARHQAPPAAEEAERRLEELAEGPPEVGSWVLSAAAWGTERPVVSLGIVSGTDRTLRGAAFFTSRNCAGLSMA